MSLPCQVHFDTGIMARCKANKSFLFCFLYPGIPFFVQTGMNIFSHEIKSGFGNILFAVMIVQFTFYYAASSMGSETCRISQSKTFIAVS